MTLLETLRWNFHMLLHFLLLSTCLGIFRYAEKRWASKGGYHAATKLTDTIFNCNESPTGGTKSGIPRSRRLSLEESILVSHMAQVPPPVTRSREGSLDLPTKISVSPPIKRPSVSLDFDNLSGKSTGTVDPFGFNDKKSSSVPPSNWTTFD
ncbi:unnamed protein product [Lupinus luteus]|uniref:Uncharacterized protein n=1 Tax=Lupinus luteus TaxID=3873 RepID=A0AAV1XRF0_LUPLU